MKKEREVSLNFKDLLVFRIICELTAIKGIPPTSREILTELKYAKSELEEQGKEYGYVYDFGSNSTSIIAGSLTKLEEANLIKREKGKPRSIKILGESPLPPIIRISKNFPS